MIEPGGKEIYWNDTKGRFGGELDVDNVEGFGPENIYWLKQSTDGSKELGPGPPGEYKWFVVYYGGNRGIPVATRWKVRIKHEGRIEIVQGRLTVPKSRSRTYTLKVGGGETAEPPAGPCPLSTAKKSRPARETGPRLLIMRGSIGGACSARRARVMTLKLRIGQPDDLAPDQRWLGSHAPVVQRLHPGGPERRGVRGGGFLGGDDGGDGAVLDGVRAEKRGAGASLTADLGGVIAWRPGESG